MPNHKEAHKPKYVGSRLCAVDGCDKFTPKRLPRYTKNWCAMHYKRWQRYGDVQRGRKPGKPKFYCKVHKDTPDPRYTHIASPLFCKSCSNHTWPANKEKLREYALKKYHTDPEYRAKCLAANREWHKRNPEKVRLNYYKCEYGPLADILMLMYDTNKKLREPTS